MLDIMILRVLGVRTATNLDVRMNGFVTVAKFTLVTLSLVMVKRGRVAILDQAQILPDARFRTPRHAAPDPQHGGVRHIPTR